jgi:serine/threonine-protein kinase 24/25/MST4
VQFSFPSSLRIKMAEQPAFHAGAVLSSDTSNLRYRLVRALGAGAFGEVWLCEETQSNGLRAVKIGTNALAEIAPNEVRILQEAFDNVGESYVPRFYEASAGSFENGLLVDVLVMEFIDGVSAGTLARAMPIPEEFAKVVLTDVVCALKRLHEGGIVHCDVKGDNILLSRTGRCYLCDYGVSKSLNGPGRLEALAGSPGWMAPEVACINELREANGTVLTAYDTKADVWSLGIFAVELVIGDSPWRAVAIEEGWGIDKVMKKVSREHAPEKMQDSGFSDAYFDFVNMCLEREPVQRPSAQELMESQFLRVCSRERRKFAKWVSAACASVAP